MTAKWYFQMMGETVGPLTGGELRERALQGQISGETLIGKDGSDRWVRADRVQGLMDAPTDVELATSIQENKAPKAQNASCYENT